MAVLDVDSIIEKIKIAEQDSPIAVFLGPYRDRLNAVFAHTVETQRWIRDGVHPLVGVYHNKMNIEQIRRFLHGVIDEAAVL